MSAKRNGISMSTLFAVAALLSVHRLAQASTDLNCTCGNTLVTNDQVLNLRHEETLVIRCERNTMPYEQLTLGSEREYNVANKKCTFISEMNASPLHYLWHCRANINGLIEVSGFDMIGNSFSLLNLTVRVHDLDSYISTTPEPQTSPPPTATELSTYSTTTSSSNSIESSLGDSIQDNQEGNPPTDDDVIEAANNMILVLQVVVVILAIIVLILGPAVLFMAVKLRRTRKSRMINQDTMLEEGKGIPHSTTFSNEKGDEESDDNGKTDEKKASDNKPISGEALTPAVDGGKTDEEKVNGVVVIDNTAISGDVLTPVDGNRTTQCTTNMCNQEKNNEDVVDGSTASISTNGDRPNGEVGDDSMTESDELNTSTKPIIS